VTAERAFFLLLCVVGGGATARAQVFFAGETLAYTTSWGGITGGQMTITASKEIEFAERPAIKIELSAFSNAFISKFFVVRDLITSWIDARTLQSIRFEKHTVEGKHVRDERIEFDHQENVARLEGATVPFQPPVFDSLSSVYYLRTRKLSAGEPIELEMVSGKHAYRLIVDVIGKESVRTPAGVFTAWKVHPKMKEGLLRKEGDLWLWLTDDERKIPVVIRSKLSFGTLTARLLALPAGSSR
jgi:hypothetical protein